MATDKTASGKTLYHRLGGYDVIASVIDDYMASMRTDPSLQRFSAGRSADSRARSRQLLVEQLCALAGGPCVYIGRDMKTSHAGLGITEGEWESNMQYIARALDRHEIPVGEQAEFMELFERYKVDIVDK